MKRRRPKLEFIVHPDLGRTPNGKVERVSAAALMLGKRTKAADERFYNQVMPVCAAFVVSSQRRFGGGARAIPPVLWGRERNDGLGGRYPRDMASQTFWIVPRGVIDPSGSNTDLHRALLTHVILFAGPTVLVDSDVVLNRYLREALRTANDQGFMRDLVTSGYLKFAIRTVGGDAVALAATTEDIANRAGRLRAIYEPFGDAPEYRFIERHPQAIVEYAFEDAVQRYQRETVRVFRDNEFSRADLPKAAKRAIVSVLDEYIERSSFFGWSHFRKDTELGREIERRSRMPTLFERHGTFIYSVARGPYVTFLPEKFGMRAHYSAEDELGLSVWHQRSGEETELTRRQSRTALLDLADYVKGLCALTADDLHELRSSSAQREFEAAWRRYSIELGDPETVVEALAAYRDTIAERIYRRLLHLPVRRNIVLTEVRQHRRVGSEIVRYVSLVVVPMAMDALVQSVFGIPFFGSLWYLADRSAQVAKERAAADEREDVQRETRAAVLAETAKYHAKKKAMLWELVGQEAPTVAPYITEDARGVPFVEKST